MKIILFTFFFITNICLAQQNIKFDSISIINGDTSTMKFKCRTTFTYFQQGFVLVSEDLRVYSYLLPGTEFFDLQSINFYDTGKTLTDTLTKKTIVIYESKYKNMQIAQYVVDKGIMLMKRNSTGILFY